MLGQHKLIYILLTLCTVLLVWYTGNNYFDHQAKQLYRDSLVKEQKIVKDQINEAIAQKQESLMAMAITLSESLDLIELDRHADQSREMIKTLTKKLKEYTLYKNIWIQLINKDGISAGRSWTPKYGDNLIQIRRDLQQMLKQPRPIENISVGKFSVSLKAMIPMFKTGDDKKKKFNGVIEIIAHFNSIVNALKKYQYQTLIFVDKSYKKQLTRTLNNTFVDDYYVANFILDQKLIEQVNQLGLEKILYSSSYVEDRAHFYTSIPIKNLAQNTIAYAVVVKPLNLFEFTELHNFTQNAQIILASLILLIIIGFIIFYWRQHEITKQKNYFKQVLDSSPGIMVILQEKKPIEVNRGFYDFFNNQSLPEIMNRIGCIDNLFIDNEGCLSRIMGKQSWFDYVLEHPLEHHKITIHYMDKNSIFSVNLNRVYQDSSDFYIMSLNDISQLEHYKNELEHLSQTDSLTSIGNRYYFEKRLQEEFDRSRRYHHSLSLILLDIDFFKRINDTHGHDIGDIVLKELSHIIKDLLRRSDIFARYGGEEFIILMPESNIVESEMTAERIRKNIEQHSFLPVKSLTISLGVTQLTKEDDIKSFIKRADQALYAAKNNGRNQVMID
ncbi:MAG: diguanylate cyclase [Gammaproteobacteria bacterium]|nr:diguanylate cyclase [Gammaproteobacteria bacterium]